MLFSLAGLTGSALVFRGEIDALLHPQLLRVDPVTERVSLDAVLRAADQAVAGARPARIQMPRTPEEAFEVTTTGEHPVQVYVHPGTGEVLGIRRADETLPNALFELHHTLLAGEAGERVMGVTALLALVLLASGLVVWWPGMRRGWEGIRRALTIRGSTNWRAIVHDLHRTVGFWVAGLLAVSAFTGASLVFHEQFMAGLDRLTSSESRPAPPPLPPRGGSETLPVDALVEAHRERVPEGQVTYVLLPATNTAPLIIREKTAGELHPSGRNFVYVDPASGEVVATEVEATAPKGTRLYNVLYPIHIGRWGGLPTRILLVALGLTPLLFLITGIIMWWNRSLRRLGRRPVRDPALSGARS